MASIQKRDFKKLLEAFRALSPEERKQRALALAKAVTELERRGQKESM